MGFAPKYTDYHFNFAAKLHAHISSMQAGFGAYAQTVKYHSLMLKHQQKRIDDLEDSNHKKDVIISRLEESRVRMSDTIEEHERFTARVVEEHEKSRVIMVATIQEHEEARVRMAADIEELEKRINEMQQNNGTIY